MPIELVDSNVVFRAGPQGKYCTVLGQNFRNEKGDIEKHYIFGRGRYATILCRTSDGHFVVLEQFRHAVNRYIHCLPGGEIDPSESPAAAAQRELLEETGYQAPRWYYLDEFDDPELPDKSTGRTFYFFCADAVRVAPLEKVEGIRALNLINEETLLEWARTGKLVGQPSKAAIMHYLLDKDRLPHLQSRQ